MAKKQFKTESKKLLDMMINSIYTHREIFLRELISNASDAIDKLYFKSLTDSSVGMNRSDFEIRIAADKDARTITISDNGIGMTKEQLESNLGTIAKSGSLEFKKENEGNADKPDIIGQFGVGFYSAFMVADKVTVVSRAFGSDTAAKWESSGVDGYTIEDAEKEKTGTEITLHLKADTDDDKYSDYTEEYEIKRLVKKYSDYIRYPIRMLTSHEKLKEGSKDEYETVKEDETLNSMIPIWRKSESEVKEEEYASFYTDKFMDYDKPAKVIRQKTDGTSEYIALLFIPSHAPFDYYSRDYEKGLQLYSSGVMIMEKCKELIPDYFSFVKGLVDSSDLSLNISRETLQQDRQVKIIAKALEKKIATELKKWLSQDREAYDKFFKEFGSQLKYGVYSDYGMHKETLQDLIMFKSSDSDKYTTLSEYVSRMKEDQKKIFYAAGDNVEQISMLPQVDAAKSKGYEVLYLDGEIDEFAFQMLRTYNEKEFSDVCKDNSDLTTDTEKETLKKENENSADMFKLMKETIGGVKEVKFTNTLASHPACISTEGNLSVGMEKVLNRMPGAGEGVKAEIVLEINMNHPIADKLKKLYSDGDKDTLAKYTKILYASARLISGMSLDNAAETGDMITDLLLK